MMQHFSWSWKLVCLRRTPGPRQRSPLEAALGVAVLLPAACPQPAHDSPCCMRTSENGPNYTKSAH